MAFILESTYDGAGTIIENELMMTDSEAGVKGEAVKAVSGRLTKAATTDAPEFILAKTTAAGTDVETEYIRVRRDQVFLADVVGTIANIAEGDNAVEISDDGLFVNADGANTAGRIIIHSIDTVNNKARVSFNV